MASFAERSFRFPSVTERASLGANCDSAASSERIGFARTLRPRRVRNINGNQLGPMAQSETTMTKKKVISPTPNVAAEFAKLFGPPPLFKSDHTAIYEAILEGLAEEEKSRSFIARILIRDVADLVYQRLWLRSLGPRLTRQALRNKVEVAATVAQVSREVLGGKSSVTDESLRQLRAAEEGPFDEAYVFLGWIGHYERVQSLLAAADDKLRDTLKLLDEYRHGLGQRVRQIADEILDAELEGPLEARQPKLATPAVVATVAPRPAAELVASPVEVSASSRPVTSRERRRLHSAGVQRRRRSAPTSGARVQSNLTTLADSESGQIAKPSQDKSH